MVTIALVQYGPSPDRDANLARVGTLIDEAVLAGAKLILLPELFAVPFVPTDPDEGWIGYAEPRTGVSNEFCRDRSSRHGIAVVSSYFESATMPGVFHNSVAVYRGGEAVHHYRKSHVPLSHHFHEKTYFRPGNLPPDAFDIDGLRAGVIICYERHFPELVRLVALQGAHLIAIPVAAANQSARSFHAELRGHAISNQIYVAAVNRIGTEGSNRYYGMSAVFGPDGELLQSAGNGEEVLLVDISPDLVADARRDFPFYRDRRPDLYAPIARPE